MDIKKTDTKGRVTVGTKGEAYSQTVQPDGTIILKPLIPPKPPVMDSEEPHAVYVDYSGFVGRAHTITLHAPGDSGYVSQLVLGMAQDGGGLPIVVNSAGMGALIADKIRDDAQNHGSGEPATVLCVNPSAKKFQEDRAAVQAMEDFAQEGKRHMPYPSFGTVAAGLARLREEPRITFGEGINWLPPVAMDAVFGAAGLRSDRVSSADIVKMPSDYRGPATWGLLVRIVLMAGDSATGITGLEINDGERSTYRAIVPLLPSTLKDGPAEKGDADNSAPSAEATKIAWDANNACPWNCSYRHVHVARRSDNQGYWRPRTAGELRRVTPDAEPTDGTTADADRPPMSAQMATKFIDMKSKGLAGGFTMFKISASNDDGTPGTESRLHAENAKAFIQNRPTARFFVRRVPLSPGDLA